MALATNTSPGEIRLAGDLGGNNNALAPELSPSGVTAGSYSNASITINSKGLITSATSDAIPIASSTVLGLIRVGTGLTIDGSGILSVNSSLLAEGNTTFGLVKSNNTNNITITSGLIDVGSNIPKLNTQNTYTATQSSSFVSLTDGATITVDASLSNYFTVTLGENRTLANPTNLTPGVYVFKISQDSTGNRLLSYGSAYKFKTQFFNTLSTAPNAIDILVCVSDGTNMYCSVCKEFV